MKNSTFMDWFDTKLKVGETPSSLESIQTFDAIISVSDQFPSYFYEKIPYLWLPMGELFKESVSISSLYGCMIGLYQMEHSRSSNSVYLHCQLGINRSRMCQSAYFFMRTGEHLGNEESYLTGRGFINSLLKNAYSNKPLSKEDVEFFLLQLGAKLEGNEVCHGLLDDLIFEVKSRIKK